LIWRLPQFKVSEKDMPAAGEVRDSRGGRALDKWVRTVSGPANVLMWAAAAVVMLMMLHVCADVAGKYVSRPLYGTIEVVSAYYMVAVVFLPLAYVTASERHIVVELFTRGLKDRRLLRWKGAVGVITFAYVLLFTWKTLEEAIERTAGREVWESSGSFIVVYPSRWLLPVGCGAMAVVALVKLLHDLRRSMPDRR
jgi:TRAP-type C4-dicarboxylate transport system permease small subunit